ARQADGRLKAPGGPCRGRGGGSEAPHPQATAVPRPAKPARQTSRNRRQPKPVRPTSGPARVRVPRWLRQPRQDGHAGRERDMLASVPRPERSRVAMNFALPGTRGLGCLLVHGFTATPAEMRPLGEALAARGFPVRGVRLAGHGTSVEDLARTGWRDWYASVEHDLGLL